VRWWTFDAGHNVPRIGRVVMATGRDATTVRLQRHSRNLGMVVRSDEIR